MFVVALILQKYTPFGRYVYAIGDNEQVPKMAGINVNKVKIQAFIWSGICIGIAGVLMLALLGRGDVTMGKGSLFPALTAVVVGGTATSGGRGGVVNTLIGALIMTVLRSGLIMFGVNQYLLVGAGRHHTDCSRSVGSKRKEDHQQSDMKRAGSNYDT